MKTFNKASFAFALSTSILLAGCGSSTAPQEKTAYLVSSEEKLLLRIVPSCNKEGVGVMQFDRLTYAEHWAENTLVKLLSQVSKYGEVSRVVSTKEGRLTEHRLPIVVKKK